MYPRFCSRQRRIASTLSLRRHLSHTSCCGGLWSARCYLTRPHRCGKIQPSCDSRTHLPCSRLHARLAGDITVTAGRLLPYPFTPDRLDAFAGIGGGAALCCGCSHNAVASIAPPLAVSWGNRSDGVASLRRESGSSSTGACRQ